MSTISNTKKKLLSGGNIKQYSMLIALAVIIALFYWLTGGTLGAPMNVANLIAQNGYVVILAIGMLMCILSGGNIDLSVGSVIGFVGACAGVFIIQNKMNIYLGAGICLLIGLAIGAWQGFWIAYVRIPAFIVTLSGMLVFRGLTLSILGGLTLSPFPQSFLSYSTGFIPDPIGPLLGVKNGTSLLVGMLIAAVFIVSQLFSYESRRRKGYDVGSRAALISRLLIISAVLIALFAILAQYRGIPTVLVLLGVILLVYSFITTNTVMGRHLYALGGNEKASRLSGVKTNRMLFLVYANMGLLAAVAGLVFSARLNSASPTAGQSLEMDAIASCYIGGASAYGGIGTVSGTLIGALIMGILNNGMSILGVRTSDQMAIKGLVLLAAVAFDVISKKQTALADFPNPFKRAKKKQQSAVER